MSFVQTSIFDDGFVECPACGEYVLLGVEELELFNKGDSVPVCCYDCNTIFYLEKEEDYGNQIEKRHHVCS